MTTNDWYKIDDIGYLDSPALVVYPERVKANIQTAIRMVDDPGRLRPHIKTNKSPDAVSLMINAGITKFKCATIAEAEMLGIAGAKDVVLAYQPVGPKLLRFISVIKKFPSTQFACLTDNMQAAKDQSATFAANDLTIPVYIDLNVGMNRTGITPGQPAIDLYSFLAAARGIRIGGIHAYDGHIRDSDMTIRTKQCDEAFAKVEKIISQLESNGYTVPVIIAGGSTTFPIHAKRKDIECSPGTFIYWDKGYLDTLPEQHFLPAAVLVTRIVSLPAADLICTDLGHKSVSAENEINKRVYFLNGEGLIPTAQSEEHLVLKTLPGHSFKTGDILYGIPFHICPTVALYEKVYTIENGKVSGNWKNTARDRMITI